MHIDPPIGPFETETLRTLDRTCRAYHNEKNNPEQSTKSIGEQMREIAPSEITVKKKQT